MRKLMLAAALALGLGGCAAVSSAWNDVHAITGAVQSASVSPKAIYVAVNAFDAVEITATNYLDQCPRPTPTGLCYGADKVRAAVIPAIRSGIIVRKKLVAAARAAGDGPVALTADWNTLQSVTATIKSILIQYGVTAGAQ